MDNLVLDIKFSNESTTEPVSVEEAKNWLKIDVPDDDPLLKELITAARQQCEGYLNISLIGRTVTAWLQIGLDEIRLPYGPVQSVTSVSNFKGEPIQGYELKYEMFKALDPTTEVKCVYEAGFNGNIPKHFKISILNQIAWQYEHRGDETEQQNSTLAPEAIRRLKPYRRVT